MTNILFNFSNTIISVESNSPPILKEIKNLFLPFYTHNNSRTDENHVVDIKYSLEVSGEPPIEGKFYGRVYQILPYTFIARDTFTSLSVNSVLKQSQNEIPRFTRNDKNKKLLYESGDPFEFISFIEWIIIDTALEKMEGFYQIHGGAVVKNNMGLILPAAPGSGKTTLTVALTMNGFKCLSDDIVLIDADSLKLNPFSRNIFITEEKKDVFDRYGIGLPLRKSEWMEYGGWDFIPPHPVPLPQGEREFNVDFIIFPNYNPAQKTELKRISKGKAIFEIIKESFNIHKFRDRGVDIVHRLVENAECYQLTVNNLNEAVDIISDLFMVKKL